MSNVPEIDSNVLSLEEIYMKGFYIVPDFQREYVWKTENVDALLTDIYNEFFDDDDKSSEYFIGSIVVYPEDKLKNTYSVVDGQQRLTTCYLVFCAIRNRLSSQRNGEVPPFLNELIISNHFNSDYKNILRQRLTLQYEESQGILENIAKNTQFSEKQEYTGSVKNIREAYDAIESFLEVNFKNNPEQILKFLSDFTSRVKLIQIITANPSHALKIFETINHRGIDLDAMDLLKNLLFREANSKEYDIIKVKRKQLTKILGDCKEKPLRFLRYYILSHYGKDEKVTKKLKEEDVYDWFADNSKICGIENNPIKFVEILIEQGKVYKNFVDCKDVMGNYNPNLYNIKQFGKTIRQHFILLLAGQHLSEDLFKKLCINIEKILFCSVVTHVRPNVFESNFSKWANELRKVKDVKDLDNIITKSFNTYLLERSSSFDHVFSEMTESSVQKYRLNYIIAKLNQFVDEDCNKQNTELEEYLKNSRIEYILPKTNIPSVTKSFDKITEYDFYRVKLGNLIFIEKTINTSGSDVSFETKKQTCHNSSYMLNKCLVEFPTTSNENINPVVKEILRSQVDDWDSKAIIKRQNMIGRLAREIWLPILQNNDDILIASASTEPKMSCPDCRDVSLGYLQIENSKPILKCNCGNQLEINCDRFVFDTNIWVSQLFSNLVNTDFFENKIIFSPETVIDEINNWKNNPEKSEIRNIAIQENKCVKEWRDKGKLRYETIGKDASYSELIKKGNPDKIIAKDATKNDAILITSDSDYIIYPDVTVIIYKKNRKVESDFTEKNVILESQSSHQLYNNILTEGETIELKIEGESHGDGVGYYQKHTVFVSSAGDKIGDNVTVKIYKVFLDRPHAKGKIITEQLKY